MSKALATKPRDNFFDFKADASLPGSFAHDYLRQYYLPEREVTNDERAIYRFIRSIAAGQTRFGRALEVGCGPTVHHAIMLAPFVKAIDLADYLEENLAVVEKWRRGDADAWDWSDYSDFCSCEDGMEPLASAITKREELTRQRIRALRAVNLLEEAPLGPLKPQYDLVATFYCTEEIALTLESWREVMRAVKSLIRPGGHLLMSCLANTDFYHIRSADNSVRSLPCVNISKEDIESMLDELGFSKEERRIEEYQTPEQAFEGVKGVLMTFAKSVE